MPFKPNERVYRSMALLESRMDNADPLAPKYRVEGYASTFERYKLFDDYDGPIYEQIDKRAFDGADMTDVIMQYDHQGKVFARTSNGTLQLSVDDHGLKIAADLSLTEASRELWNEISCGLITRMSFCFIIADAKFDPATRTNNITKIGKLYDVSAVSIPANPGTDIEARSQYDGEIIKALKEFRAKRARLALRARMDALKYGG